MAVAGALSQDASAQGVPVLLSVEDDIWTDYRLPFLIAPGRIDLKKIRCLKGVRKAWTE